MRVAINDEPNARDELVGVHFVDGHRMNGVFFEACHHLTIERGVSHDGPRSDVRMKLRTSLED